MYIGNVMLLILNVPLAQMFVQILKIPRQLLLPLIVLMCLVGVYSVNSSFVDLYVLALFGVAGFVLRTLGYEPAPLVLALVIGPMMETAMRESLIMYRGDVSRMILRPIAGTIYVAALAALVAPALLKLIRPRAR
jgi:putative tricarboxylic transport membrane protein